MNPPKNRENSITRYYITEENLVGSVKERKADYDLMAAVMENHIISKCGITQRFRKCLKNKSCLIWE